MSLTPVRSWLCLWVALSISIAGAQEPGAEIDVVRLEVSPGSFDLSGATESLQLVVTAFTADGRVYDRTHAAEYVSRDPQVVTCSQGVVRPVGDGRAIVEVRVGNQQATTDVSVTNFDSPQPVSFQYGALVALSKQGCNAGACHGSPSGKGGFRLSLRAFDAELDEYTLLREELGRRINLVEPSQSLLLLKPLMKVSHGGGLQIHTTDPAYRILRDWISQGACVDDDDAPKCVGIRVFPDGNRILNGVAPSQQFSVIAEFSDGTRRDVTEVAVYSSSDTAVATVDEYGRATGHDRGEAAVVVRYLEFIESTILTFVREVDGYEWAEVPTNSFIDELIHQKLRKLQYLPSDVCTDEEFLRRVYLDLIGHLPTVEQSRAFLSDAAADKRATLIDTLLERPDYAKFWALKWGDLLRLTKGQVGDDAVYKYHRWIERAIAENLPYDDFARQLLTATGSTFENPPANFFRTAGDMNDCVETISQIFLGARLQCAKCHNHPFERWTQDNYYGMGAFFNRIQRKKTRRANELFVWSSTNGEVTQPRTGATMQPWVPAAGTLTEVADDDRRKTFAEWLTSSTNPYFSKIEVNRIWSHLLGRGIVDPVDDFRESNPPANGPLLDALAQEFVEHEFDRKHIVRLILNSRTYQMSHQPNEFNRDDNKYFSHYWPRLLTAEQMLDAICHVTGMPETFETLPVGLKATQLPAPDLANHEFLKVFGQPERQTVCQCERTTDSNLGMAIQFLNGPLIHNKVRSDANRFNQLISDGKSDEEVVNALTLAALSRHATQDELVASLEHMESKRGQLLAENSRQEKALDDAQSSLRVLEDQLREKVQGLRVDQVSEPIREDVRRALATSADQRTDVENYLAEKFQSLKTIVEEDFGKELPEEDVKRWQDATAQAQDIEESILSVAQIRVVGLEDICWVLLNRNEFLFNH